MAIIETIEGECRKGARLQDGIDKLLDVLESNPSPSITALLNERERELEHTRARISTLQSRLDWEKRSALAEPELREFQEVLKTGDPSEQRAVLDALLIRIRVWNDQIEIEYRLPVPPHTEVIEDGRSTPSGIRTRDLHLERVAS